VTVSERFGENLKLARKRAEVSQEALGLRADLHRTEVSQLERGLRIPRVDTLAKLCGALEVDVITLMDGIVWQPSRIDYGSFQRTSPSSG
jgi:transcriptional regulator with XRE-family HTH domain